MQKRNKYLSSLSENAEQVKVFLAEAERAEMTEQKMRSILAECAKQLLIQRFGQEEWSFCCWLAEALEKCDSGCDVTDECRKTGVSFVYEEKEDLLGYLYLSLRELKERKKSGSYYTPKAIAKRVTNGLTDEEGKQQGAMVGTGDFCIQTLTILDPACGTGSILLELPAEWKLQQIYGYDIDPVAVAIVRINMALKYQIYDEKLLTEHFAVGDFLQKSETETADLILGNPPWGSKLTREEKEQLNGRFQTAGQKAVESCDLFVEQSMKVLRPGGKISFILPEALLHVKTHRVVRSLMLEQCYIKRVEYLGEVFDKVQCPSVILTLEKRKQNECNIPDDKAVRPEKADSVIEVITDKRRFVIYPDSSGRTMPRFSEEGFLLDVTEEELALLRKVGTMENLTCLKGQAEFALGIVTGKNAKYLLEKMESGSEPVLRGSDIERFWIKEASSYLRFAPECYQQVAPTECYRAPEKLLYRFVGMKPVFAYDDRQTLTLNSCNIVIPAVAGMDMQYIMAVFNSTVIEFWHKRVNHSMKMLRAHIECFPIPMVGQEQQQEIIRYVELLRENEREIKEQSQMTGEQNERVLDELCVTRERICTRLDWKIAELFGLTEAEYEQIICSVDRR